MWVSNLIPLRGRGLCFLTFDRVFSRLSAKRTGWQQESSVFITKWSMCILRHIKLLLALHSWIHSALAKLFCCLLHTLPNPSVLNHNLVINEKSIASLKNRRESRSKYFSVGLTSHKASAAPRHVKIEVTWCIKNRISSLKCSLVEILNYFQILVLVCVLMFNSTMLSSCITQPVNVGLFYRVNH